MRKTVNRIFRKKRKFPYILKNVFIVFSFSHNSPYREDQIIGKSFTRAFLMKFGAVSWINLHQHHVNVFHLICMFLTTLQDLKCSSRTC